MVGFMLFSTLPHSTWLRRPPPSRSCSDVAAMETVSSQQLDGEKQPDWQDQLVGQDGSAEQLAWYFVAIPVSSTGEPWEGGSQDMQEMYDRPSLESTPWSASTCDASMFGDFQGQVGVSDASGMLEKTQLCKYFVKGRCKRGQNCTFAHGARQLRARPDLYRTQMCVGYMNSGTCGYGDKCRFAHTWEELRPVEVLDAAPERSPADRRRRTGAADIVGSHGASGFARGDWDRRCNSKPLRADAPAFYFGDDCIAMSPRLSSTASGGASTTCASAGGGSECGGDDAGPSGNQQGKTDCSPTQLETSFGTGGRGRGGALPWSGVRWADEEDDDDELEAVVKSLIGETAESRDESSGRTAAVPAHGARR